MLSGEQSKHLPSPIPYPIMKILYAASEIVPFLSNSPAASLVRDLAQYMQEKGSEIRILVPRFGVINERKSKLHDVVRLSGTKIKVGNNEKLLMIKVASIPYTRIQVYFIYNEDYFKRKAVFHGKDNLFFQDNAERAAFFCKGVLETVRKLEWIPDIVHCHDWLTSLIPFYLKTVYHNDPILRTAQAVWTLHNHVVSHKFDQEFIIDETALPSSQEKASQPLAIRNFEDLIQTGAKYADCIVKAEALQDELLKSVLCGRDLTYIKRDQSGLEAYHKLYTELIAKR